MTIRGAKAPAIITAMLLSAAWLTGHAATITPLIVGGEDAPEDTFPWMAALKFSNGGPQFCGGSLIAPGWVITAAHCVVYTETDDDENEFEVVRSADEIEVMLDETDLSATSPRIVGLSKVIPHPDYDLETLDNDLALLLLDTPQIDLETASLTDEQAQQAAEIVIPDNLETLGWGATNRAEDKDDLEFPDKLQYVRLQYLPFNECQNHWGGLTDNMLCAWEPDPPEDQEDGQDTCFGDSGGPLFLTQNDAPLIIGVTSFGDGVCGMDEEGNQVPGGYVRVINYLQWVEATSFAEGEAHALVSVEASIAEGIQSGADGQADLARVPITVTNRSKLNDATGAGFTLTLPADLTLEAWHSEDGLSCSEVDSLWECTFSASPLLFGNSFSGEIDLRYDGTEGSAFIQAQAFADQDNYRAGRRDSRPVEIVYTDKPVLDMNISTNTSSNSATLSYTVRNLSSHADAENTLLEIALPGGLSLSATSHEGCQASAEGVSCALGTLAAGSDVSLSVTLAGSTGSYTVTSSLSTSNGIFPDDIVTASSAFRIAAKTHSSSSGGGSAGIVALLLILLPGYRRRNQRSSQVSN